QVRRKPPSKVPIKLFSQEPIVSVLLVKALKTSSKGEVVRHNYILNPLSLSTLFHFLIPS
ncbi:MAG: hypothetical protein ACW97X_03485, partial [Candidatus Hodarchaeales archaeon]